MADVLSYVEYDLRSIRNRLKQSPKIRSPKAYITAQERKTILANYEEGLRGYTYFEKE